MVVRIVARELLERVGRVEFGRVVAGADERNERLNPARFCDIKPIVLIVAKHRDCSRRMLMRACDATLEQINQRRDAAFLRDRDLILGIARRKSRERSGCRLLRLRLLEARRHDDQRLHRARFGDGSLQLKIVACKIGECKGGDGLELGRDGRLILDGR